MLAAYLGEAGHSAFQIGAIITATLLGSALLTLLVGVMGHRVMRRRLLFASTALMLFTGRGFAFARHFWTLLVVGVIGTLNPSGGDVSVFLPTEHSLLSESVAGGQSTALFARYNLSGIFAVAVGSLFAGTPLLVANAFGAPLVEVQRYSFLV
jgi:MFS family permease